MKRSSRSSSSAAASASVAAPSTKDHSYAGPPNDGGREASSTFTVSVDDAPEKRSSTEAPSFSSSSKGGGESSSSTAAFLDGAARAAALPLLAPLAGRLLSARRAAGSAAAAAAGVAGRTAASAIAPSSAAKLAATAAAEASATWPALSLRASYLLAAYALGLAVGSSSSFLSVRLAILSDGRTFRRTVGVVAALYAFFLGSGTTTTTTSFHWAATVRFGTALTVGLLCGATKPVSAGVISEGEKSQPQVRFEDEMDEESAGGEASTSRPTHRHQGGSGGKEVVVQGVSKYAKMRLGGFASSSLLTGWLYDRLVVQESAAFAALTGTYPRTLSPLFFVAIVLTVERLLRRVGVGPPDAAFGRRPTAWRIGCSMLGIVVRTIGDVLRSIGDLVSKCGGWIRRGRRRGGRGGGGSSGGLVGHSYLQGDVTEEELMEFHDPLSESKHGLLVETDALPGTNRDRDAFAGESHGTSHDGRSDQVSRYVDGKCAYSDGSPAYVPPGRCTSVVPPPFLEICSGNQRKADAMWAATQQWRRRDGAWNVHSRRHEWFASIKEAYPHFAHGYSKKGYPIVYEQPGKMNLKQLFRQGIQVKDMLFSYVYFMEYVQNVLCRLPELQSKRRRAADDPEGWGLMLVMDISGASLSSLSGDVVKYMKAAGDINSAHYPLSMKRAFVVNSPFWLAGAWSGIKVILPESVHVDLLSSSEYGAKLREFIDDDQIPPEYGGSSPYSLGSHPFERDLARIVERGLSSSTTSTSTSASPTADIEAGSTSAEEGENAEAAAVMAPRSIGLDGEKSAGPESMGSLGRTSSIADREFEDVPLAAADETERAPLLSSADDARDNYSNGGATALRQESPAASSSSSSGGSRRVLVLVSIMHFGLYAARGCLELSLPLWISCPPALGGVGYGPVRTGLVLSVAGAILLWLAARTPRSAGRVIGAMPRSRPMRCFRIGSGAQAVLLAILPIMPATQPAESRMYSAALMTVTTLLVSSMLVACSIGQSASGLLHEMAIANHNKSHPHRTHAVGRFSSPLATSGEIIGILSSGILFGWSVTDPDSPFPFNAACCFYVAALLHLVLYALCFSFHVSPSTNEFVPHPVEKLRAAARRADGCALTREFLFVLMGDCSALFEGPGGPNSSYEPSARSRAMRHI